MSMLKLSRYERKVARDASLKHRLKTGKIIQLHFHECTCTKKWLCRSSCCTQGRASICYHCFAVRRAEEEKKRAIEAELNSGQQMQINFTPEYAQYSDFITFTSPTSIPSVLYWVDQPWVSYKVMYNVHKGSPAKKISAEAVEVPQSIKQEGEVTTGVNSGFCYAYIVAHKDSV